MSDLVNITENVSLEITACILSSYLQIWSSQLSTFPSSGCKDLLKQKWLVEITIRDLKIIDNILLLGGIVTAHCPVKDNVSVAEGHLSRGSNANDLRFRSDIIKKKKNHIYLYCTQDRF